MTEVAQPTPPEPSPLEIIPQRTSIIKLDDSKKWSSLVSGKNIFFLKSDEDGCMVKYRETFNPLNKGPNAPKVNGLVRYVIKNETNPECYALSNNDGSIFLVKLSFVSQDRKKKTKQGQPKPLPHFLGTHEFHHIEVEITVDRTTTSYNLKTTHLLSYNALRNYMRQNEMQCFYQEKDLSNMFSITRFTATTVAKAKLDNKDKFFYESSIFPLFQKFPEYYTLTNPPSTGYIELIKQGFNFVWENKGWLGISGGIIGVGLVLSPVLPTGLDAFPYVLDLLKYGLITLVYDSVTGAFSTVVNSAAITGAITVLGSVLKNPFVNSSIRATLSILGNLSVVYAVYRSITGLYYLLISPSPLKQLGLDFIDPASNTYLQYYHRRPAREINPTHTRYHPSEFRLGHVVMNSISSDVHQLLFLVNGKFAFVRHDKSKVHKLKLSEIGQDKLLSFFTSNQSRTSLYYVQDNWHIICNPYHSQRILVFHCSEESNFYSKSYIVKFKFDLDLLNQKTSPEVDYIHEERFVRIFVENKVIYIAIVILNEQTKDKYDEVKFQISDETQKIRINQIITEGSKKQRPLPETSFSDETETSQTKKQKQQQEQHEEIPQTPQETPETKSQAEQSILPVKIKEEEEETQELPIIKKQKRKVKGLPPTSFVDDELTQPIENPIVEKVVQTSETPNPFAAVDASGNIPVASLKRKGQDMLSQSPKKVSSRSPKKEVPEIYNIAQLTQKKIELQQELAQYRIDHGVDKDEETEKLENDLKSITKAIRNQKNQKRKSPEQIEDDEFEQPLQPVPQSEPEAIAAASNQPPKKVAKRGGRVTGTTSDKLAKAQAALDALRKAKPPNLDYKSNGEIKLEKEIASLQKKLEAENTTNAADLAAQDELLKEIENQPEPEPAPEPVPVQTKPKIKKPTLQKTVEAEQTKSSPLPLDRQIQKKKHELKLAKEAGLSKETEQRLKELIELQKKRKAAIRPTPNSEAEEEIDKLTVELDDIELEFNEILSTITPIESLLDFEVKEGNENNTVEELQDIIKNNEKNIRNLKMKLDHYTQDGTAIKSLLDQEKQIVKSVANRGLDRAGYITHRSAFIKKSIQDEDDMIRDSTGHKGIMLKVMQLQNELNSTLKKNQELLSKKRPESKPILRPTEKDLMEQLDVLETKYNSLISTIVDLQPLNDLVIATSEDNSTVKELTTIIETNTLVQRELTEALAQYEKQRTLIKEFYDEAQSIAGKADEEEYEKVLNRVTALFDKISQTQDDYFDDEQSGYNKFRQYQIIVNRNLQANRLHLSSLLVHLEKPKPRSQSAVAELSSTRPSKKQTTTEFKEEEELRKADEDLLKELTKPVVVDSKGNEIIIEQLLETLKRTDANTVTIRKTKATLKELAEKLEKNNQQEMEIREQMLSELVRRQDEYNTSKTAYNKASLERYKNISKQEHLRSEAIENALSKLKENESAFNESGYYPSTQPLEPEPEPKSKMSVAKALEELHKIETEIDAFKPNNDFTKELNAKLSLPDINANVDDITKEIKQNKQILERLESIKARVVADSTKIAKWNGQITRITESKYYTENPNTLKPIVERIRGKLTNMRDVKKVLEFETLMKDNKRIQEQISILLETKIQEERRKQQQRSASPAAADTPTPLSASVPTLNEVRRPKSTPAPVELDTDENADKVLLDQLEKPILSNEDGTPVNIEAVITSALDAKVDIQNNSVLENSKIVDQIRTSKEYLTSLSGKLGSIKPEEVALQNKILAEFEIRAKSYGNEKNTTKKRILNASFERYQKIKNASVERGKQFIALQKRLKEIILQINDYELQQNSLLDEQRKFEAENKTTDEEVFFNKQKEEDDRLLTQVQQNVPNIITSGGFPTTLALLQSFVLGLEVTVPVLSPENNNRNQHILQTIDKKGKDIEKWIDDLDQERKNRIELQKEITKELKKRETLSANHEKSIYKNSWNRYININNINLKRITEFEKQIADANTVLAVIKRFYNQEKARLNPQAPETIVILDEDDQPQPAQINLPQAPKRPLERDFNYKTIDFEDVKAGNVTTTAVESLYQANTNVNESIRKTEDQPAFQKKDITSPVFSENVQSKLNNVLAPNSKVLFYSIRTADNELHIQNPCEFKHHYGKGTAQVTELYSYTNTSQQKCITFDVVGRGTENPERKTFYFVVNV